MSPAPPAPPAVPSPGSARGPDAPPPGPATPPVPPIDLRRFQRQIERLYGDRDRARGVEGTFVWFVEEVGELARALKRGEPENLREEFSDVLAWLSTLASLAGIEMEDAARRYTPGLPEVRETPLPLPPPVGAAGPGPVNPAGPTTGT